MLVVVGFANSVLPEYMYVCDTKDFLYCKMTAV